MLLKPHTKHMTATYRIVRQTVWSAAVCVPLLVVTYSKTQQKHFVWRIHKRSSRSLRVNYGSTLSPSTCTKCKLDPPRLPRVVTSSKEGRCGGQVSGSDMSLLHTPTESIFPQMPELLAQRIGAQNGNIHLASSVRCYSNFLREWRAK